MRSANNLRKYAVVNTKLKVFFAELLLNNFIMWLKCGSLMVSEEFTSIVYLM